METLHDIWQPPEKKLPSQTYLGEPTKDALHLAVGIAINEWEILESSLALIFMHTVETRSNAALRAYGTIIGAPARKQALKAAAAELFRVKTDSKSEEFDVLFNAYEAAAQYRNNLAHGICYGKLDTGGPAPTSWFLYPPHYNTRKRKDGIDDASASYIYKASDILHCRERFMQLSTEANHLEQYLCVTYPL